MVGISGEAEELKEVDILAVCLNSYGYRGVTKSMSLELSVGFTSNFDIE